MRDLPTPELGELVGQIVRNAEVAALLGAFGVALGALVRNQPVAIVGVLVLAFVIEPTVVALAPEVGSLRAVQRADRRRSSRSLRRTSAADDLDLLAPGLAVLAMLAWIGVTFAAGAVLLRRRDLD